MEAEWKARQGEGFAFSYPADWNFIELNAAGEGYLLYMPGRTSGTNVVVLRNPRELEDLEELEGKLTAEVENSPHIASGEVIEVSRVRLADREAVRLHFSGVAGSNGQEFEGFQVGTLLPDGQAITATLAVFGGGDRELALETFDQILESVTIGD